MAFLPALSLSLRPQKFSTRMNPVYPPCLFPTLLHLPPTLPVHSTCVLARALPNASLFHIVGPRNCPPLRPPFVPASDLSHLAFRIIPVPNPSLASFTSRYLAIPHVRVRVLLSHPSPRLSRLLQFLVHPHHIVFRPCFAHSTSLPTSAL
ncbi:hypothetical protein B0H13DRAFT_2314176 [Mycena leptocephala]|nr:hypothetical protein B0H13DRAFT_2314176 [Mycena leptocephala]